MECEAAEDVAGLVNMVPSEAITKYDLLRLFDKELRGGVVKIVPDGGLHLDKALTRTNFGPTYRPKSYEEQVCELSVWIRAHRDLYPHYEVI